MMDHVAHMGTPLNPVSPEAAAVRTLIIVVLGIAIVVAILVTVLVTYAIIRYRDRGDDVDPPQHAGSTWVEITYTAVPFAVMLGLFIFTAMTMRVALPKESEQPPELVIIAHQWWWELQYPDGHVTTANEIHLIAGHDTPVELRSDDVVHEVWLPKLGPKMDNVPGKPNRMVLRADAPGEYLGDCAEYCGPAHAWMRLRVIAQTPEDYTAWLQHQEAAPPPMTGIAEQGRQVFAARTCIQCHAITGLGGGANVGPNLTHFGSRQTLGAGVLDNTDQNLRDWLKDPQQIKPGCYMPRMQLTGPETDQMTAYLEALK